MKQLTRQPSQWLPADWSNPITRSLAFLYLPGFQRDSAGKLPAPTVVTPSTVTLRGGSIIMPGTTATGGLQLGSGALLAGLAASSVIAVARTTAALSATPSATDGTLGGGGNALYTERAPTGNDIYKLNLVSAASGSQIFPEFTYRNDAAVLLQQHTTGQTLRANDGQPHFYGMTKNGTAHSVYFDQLFATGTYASGSNAFTNTGIVRTIGYDVADVSNVWNGEIILVAGFTRALTRTEMLELYLNPWQLFRSNQGRLQRAFAPSGAAPQKIRPNVDITSGLWLPSTGSSLAAMIDEAIADDSDYDSTIGASTMQVKLGPGVTPGSTSGLVVRYRIKGVGQMTVTLLQGATVIASWNHATAPVAYQTFAQTLTSLQAAAITDYTNLRLQFDAS